MSAYSRLSRRDSAGGACGVSSLVNAKRPTSRSGAGRYLAACVSRPPLMERLKFTESSPKQHTPALSARRAKSHLYAPSPMASDNDLSSDGGSTDASVFSTQLYDRADGLRWKTVPQRRLAKAAAVKPPGGGRTMPPLPLFLTKTDLLLCAGGALSPPSPRADTHVDGRGRKVSTGAGTPPAAPHVRLPRVPWLLRRRLQDMDASSDSDDGNSRSCRWGELEVVGGHGRAVIAPINRKDSNLHSVTPSEPSTHRKGMRWRHDDGSSAETWPSTRRDPLVCFTEGTEFIHVCKAKKKF
ncbi:hypothetical protein STCU_10248 [Strigomonas culicis]|uniref:Uncharacterized protein n=1 Tax=Strigomonas culicis TaxID=28005 RepID=S9TMM6_9TRYP|nr:hypothetical protein STCU_10248 [Strigomonas culicis]|eukprot:EPY18019.1 hypothetical protein STCU_10248 [Strigomonas culicis]